MTDHSAPLIELSAASTGFGKRTVLASASLSVAKGELVIIEGATGAGKTTLVRVLLGAQPLSGGLARVLNSDLSKITIADLTALRRQIGVVFQTPRFLEQQSVLSNATLPLTIAGWPRKRCRAEGTRWLLDAGLSVAAHKRPAQLSGGEQARLQIARALIHKPLLVLADEPFAHLDPDSAAAAEALLAAAHERGATLIITTHRPTRLAERARRLQLDGGWLV